VIDKMLFVTIWELNPDFDPSKLTDLAQTFMSKNLFPAEGVEMVGWYVTPEYWGVTISKSDTVEAIINEANGWRIAMPGIFIKFKIAPAMEVAQVLPMMTKLAKKIRG
jgi:hypothetical protein